VTIESQTAQRNVYDGSNMVISFDGSGNLTDRYLWGPAVDQVLADEHFDLSGTDELPSSIGGTLWSLDNNQNSVTDVINNAGTLEEHIAYSPFGAQTAQSTNPGSIVFAFGYTGTYTDTATTFQYHSEADTGVAGRWYDPASQEWISEDPTGVGFGPNPSEYCDNSPTNSTDPSGLVDIHVPYLFDNIAQGDVFQLSADVDDAGNLAVKVQEGQLFKLKATDLGFPFSAVVQGSFEGDNQRYKDTDSLQVAVRWSNAKDSDVGHPTNAVPNDTARQKGANWTIGGQPGSQWASWAATAPSGATHMDVVFLYTDTLFSTPANVGGADLPIVLGSFSADKVGNKWTTKAHPEDMFKRRNNQPSRKECPKLIQAAKDFVKLKTGYIVFGRPIGLSTEKSRSDNQAIIDNALNATPPMINSVNDTGYDIGPRK
jgi:RHS repeat-associated protein